MAKTPIKQKDYKIICVRTKVQVGNSLSFKLEEFTDEIQQLLIDGYQPHGSPFFYPKDENSVFQAFVKL
jgi:hypothetical protein